MAGWVGGALAPAPPGAGGATLKTGAPAHLGDSERARVLPHHRHHVLGDEHHDAPQQEDDPNMREGCLEEGGRNLCRRALHAEMVPGDLGLEGLPDGLATCRDRSAGGQGRRGTGAGRGRGVKGGHAVIKDVRVEDNKQSGVVALAQGCRVEVEGCTWGSSRARGRPGQLLPPSLPFCQRVECWWMVPSVPARGPSMYRSPGAASMGRPRALSGTPPPSVDDPVQQAARGRRRRNGPPLEATEVLLLQELADICDEWGGK